MVDTEIRGDLMSQEIFDKILSTIPMGRIASPTEIANIFLFLPRTYPRLSPVRPSMSTAACSSIRALRTWPHGVGNHAPGSRLKLP